MSYYLQNLEEICDRVVQLIKKLINALELFNYKYRIIRLKICRMTPLINLPGLLNLGRGYILMRPVNNLINLI